MKNIELSPRLKTIADMVRRGVRVADVGTDHAFLPLYLVTKGIATFATASDINEGPIKNAQNNVKAHQCEDVIKLIQCAGLDDVDGTQVDDVIIAGMGGELISEIINNAKWLKNTDKHLLLQPMTRVNELRKYLCDNGFDIVEEKIACEGERLYTIISSNYVGKQIEYDEVFLHVGKVVSNNNEASKRYILNQASVIKKIAEGMEKSDDMKEKSVKYYDLSNQILLMLEGN
ncbi:MAG: SAM-dependent methyltransferase [Clostridia bacterium]|nr:SAM-dependent methyltransferase [Clostridia bacterium]